MLRLLWALQKVSWESATAWVGWVLYEVFCVSEY